MTDVKPGRQRRPAHLASAALPLAAILGLALVLNLSNADFPLDFHADEPTKVRFVQTGTQDFHHPLLMLQLVRLARAVVGVETDQDLVVLGRLLVGILGALTALLAFSLARERLARPWALGVALSVAVSPTLVVHAHYLDERTLLTTFAVAAAAAFLRFVERPTPRATAWLGVATGLAWSSHFAGIVLLPLFVLAPILGLTHRLRDFCAGILKACLIAAGVFVVVNWPMAGEVAAFLNGATAALQHAAVGHDVRVRGWDYAFGFHLLNSLAPGMTWPALAWALGGIAATGWSWMRTDFRERWILVTAVAFYFAVEIPALKPWPDFAGYVLPVVPFLLYLAARGAARLTARASSLTARGIVVAAFAGAVVVYPLYDSARLVSELAHDTRIRASAWAGDNPGTTLIEKYAGVESGDVRLAGELGPDGLRERGIEYVLVSSFLYERFEVGSRLPDQTPSVYQTHGRYASLFTFPFHEIKPGHRSMAFSNPTIRIVDLRPPDIRALRPMSAPPDR